jgi:hypothetical protein
MENKLELQNNLLLERVFTSFKECNKKVENCLEFSEARNTDNKREIMRINTLAEGAVEKLKFAELNIYTKQLKQQFEREIDLIQESVRGSMDKMTETTFKFNAFKKETE